MCASKFMSFLSAAAWRVAEPLHLVPVVTAPTGPPPTVPSDEVFPVHYFDDTFVNRKMIMCWTMKFDDVLDPEALRSSLARLLEIGDWRKLGGRLRLIEVRPGGADADADPGSLKSVNTSATVEDGEARDSRPGEIHR